MRLSFGDLLARFRRRNDELPPDPRRRQFLSLIARVAAAAAMVATVGSLMAREHRQGEECTSNGVCRDCASLRDCALPQAMSCRQALNITK
jgi:hypothetical protein